MKLVPFVASSNLPTSCLITTAIKHLKCHAGLDPTSRSIPDFRFHGNDGFDI